MLTGPHLFLTQDGIPSFSSCGSPWCFQEGRTALWDWLQGDRRQTAAVVKEGDLAERKTSSRWMGCSWTRSLLLTTSVKQTWQGMGRGPKNVDGYSFPPSADMFFQSCHLWDLYLTRFSFLDFFFKFLCSTSLFSSLPLLFLWHFSICAPIMFSLLQDFRFFCVRLPVSQTPAQTNIVFNALLLVMKASVDLILLVRNSTFIKCTHL